MAAFLQKASSSSSAYIETAVQRQLRKGAGGSGLFGTSDGRVAAFMVLGCGLLAACVVLCRRKFCRALGRYIHDEVVDPSELKYMFITDNMCLRRRRNQVSRPKIEPPSPSASLSKIEPPRLSKIRLACLAARRPQTAPERPTTKARVASTAVSDAFGVYHRDSQVPPRPVVTFDTTREASIDDASVEGLPRLLGQERFPASGKDRARAKTLPNHPKSHKKGRSYKTKVEVTAGPSHLLK